jgi:hypothetical protein
MVYSGDAFPLAGQVETSQVLAAPGQGAVASLPMRT